MRSSPSGFRWPPAPLESTPIPSRVDEATQTSSTLDRAIAMSRRIWSDIEHAWFAPTMLPLRTQAREIGWEPDSFDEYCDHCGHTIGPHEAGEWGCSACASSRLPWSRCVRMGEYETELATWIQQIKFTRWRAQALTLGDWLGERCIDAGVRQSGLQIVVVPMPTTFRRRMSRGIDHAGLIATGVARRLDAPLVRALSRSHRPSQRSVPASQRGANVAGAMRVRRPAGLAGKLIVLVDDVMTSGATLRSAARELRSAQRERKKGRAEGDLWVAVAAVTPEHGE